MRTVIRPAARRLCTSALLLASLPGCLGRSSAPPARSSPIMASADALAASVEAASRPHTAWSAADSMIRDADETLVRMPSSLVDAFDVAPDGTLAACEQDGAISVVSAAGEMRALPSDLVPGGSALHCVDVAIASADDAWALLGASDFVSPISDALCHRDASAWSCSPLERRAVLGTLSLTAQHVWWIGDQSGHGMVPELLAVARSTPSAPPIVVVEELVAIGTLRASALSEAVLVVPPVSADDQSPQRILLDGTTTSLVARSEHAAYADVWLTRDDRVLALDVLQGESSECSSGSLGYGGGCTATVDWTQLVVWELGTGDPQELAHADYDGGGQRSIGIERTTGTFVAGDRWYALP